MSPSCWSLQPCHSERSPNLQALKGKLKFDRFRELIRSSESLLGTELRWWDPFSRLHMGRHMAHRDRSLEQRHCVFTRAKHKETQPKVRTSLTILLSVSLRDFCGVQCYTSEPTKQCGVFQHPYSGARARKHTIESPSRPLPSSWNGSVLAC